VVQAFQPARAGAPEHARDNIRAYPGEVPQTRVFVGFPPRTLTPTLSRSTGRGRTRGAVRDGTAVHLADSVTDPPLGLRFALDRSPRDRRPFGAHPIP
jgi:hypothetical protein